MRYFYSVFILSFFLLGCSSLERRAPVSDLTLSAFQTHNVEKATGSTYKVQKWDTLYGIAWVNNLSVNTLIKLNKLVFPYTIYRGEVLKLYPEPKKRKAYVSISPKKTTVYVPISPKKPTVYAPIAPKKHITYAPLPSKKSDPYYENVRKDKISTCKGQRCTKKVPKGLVPQKPTVYAKHSIDKKVTVNRNKVSVWQWPTKGKLIKTFSASKEGMKGISLKDKRGSPIYAAASGTVVYAGSGLRGYGNLIIIKHGYDYLSAYAHNEKLLVHENESIKEGQKIATMGDSGTNNVFLHFEIRYRGKSVDPLRYLPKR